VPACAKGPIPLDSLDSYQVEYSPEAQARVGRLTGIRRRTLAKRLEAMAAAGPTWRGPTEIGIGTKWELAVCEVRHQEAQVYVHAVVPRRDALRALLGEEIHARWRKQRAQKLLHGRWY
jgi:hypothetical protein